MVRPRSWAEVRAPSRAEPLGDVWFLDGIENVAGAESKGRGRPPAGALTARSCAEDGPRTLVTRQTDRVRLEERRWAHTSFPSVQTIYRSVVLYCQLWMDQIGLDGW